MLFRVLNKKKLLLAKQPKILGLRVLGVVRVLSKKKLLLAKQPKILGFRVLVGFLNKKKRRR